MRFLGERSLGPKVHALFGNGMVYDYIPGRSLSNLGTYVSKNFTLFFDRLDFFSLSLLPSLFIVLLEIYDAMYISELPLFCEKIGEALGMWHRLTETVVKERILSQQMNETEYTVHPQPITWTRLRKWINAIPVVPYTFADPQKQERLSREINLSSLPAEVNELEAALNRPAEFPVTFCHNDLLGLNIIYDAASDRMCFIDYEYANFNHRAFDIANHFCEYAGLDFDYTLFPSLDVQRRFATAYLTTLQNTTPSSAAVEALLNEVHHFVPVSHFIWGLWSLVQATVSPIDFDYLSYGLTRFKYYYLTKHYIHQPITPLVPTNTM